MSQILPDNLTLTPEEKLAIRDKTLGIVRTSPRSPALGGPGTELELLYLEENIKDKPGCNCKAIKSLMNWLGPAGCRAKRDYLLKAMRDNLADNYSKLEQVWAGAKLFLAGKPLSLEGLLNEAIRRAEAKLPA